MLRVTLAVKGAGERYLVVEDPIPAGFEAVPEMSAFRAQRLRADREGRLWHCGVDVAWHDGVSFHRFRLPAELAGAPVQDVYLPRGICIRTEADL